ncbi:MAG TPA: hypothetical protein DCS15_00290, partial [Flavobacteriales bacterium]|nr:hypothetical protein [Flavobacteriales bacterium]
QKRLYLCKIHEIENFNFLHFLFACLANFIGSSGRLEFSLWPSRKGGYNCSGVVQLCQNDF